MDAGDFVLQYGSIVVLVLFSGLFSGLTLGLMSLDKIGLEIIIGAGEAENATEKEILQAKYAKKIFPIRENGNLLLTTLLLGNVAVNALLSIILADLTSGTVGFIVSTAVIVIFGEIIPQASCSRHALFIGSATTSLVKVIIFLLFILAKPISWLLDKALGDELGTIHSKSELVKLLQIYVQRNALDVEEGGIMSGAISYKVKRVDTVMTPIEQVFMLPVTEKLGFKLIRSIFESGYSRIPVYGKNRDDIVGLLFVKDLIFVDPEEETLVLNFIHIFGRGVHKVWPDSELGDVLKLFKMGRGHLALVQDVNNAGPGDPFYEVKGLITLEDIIEEILQVEIVDETDVFVEVGKRNKVSRRGFDYDRLRLLDSRIFDETLSQTEVNAVSAHLVTNIPQFKTIGNTPQGHSELQFKDLIGKSPVLERLPSESESDELYSRGITTDFCTVLLNGKIKISAGRDNFTSEVGAWTVLAAEALVAHKEYIPDFTATFIGADKARFVKISRYAYQQTFSPGLTLSKPKDLSAQDICDVMTTKNRGRFVSEEDIPSPKVTETHRQIKSLSTST